jgi:serine protease Do
MKEMKKTVVALAPALLLFCGVTFAQSDKKAPEKKDKKEIVIEEKSSGKNEKMVIVIDGDKVTINGKSADDYKGKKHIVIDDDIVINGDMVRVPRKHKLYVHNTDGYDNNKAMLGVVTEDDSKGAKVRKVIDESAASKAGLKEGDIITKVNETKIGDHKDLISSIGKMKPNDVADITYLRNGKEQKLKATLDKNNTPNVMAWNWNDDDHFNYNYDYHVSPPLAMGGPRGPRSFNFNDNDMWVFRSDRPKYGMSIEDYADGDGVKITDVEEESNAAKAGLKKDDIITEVESTPIKGTDALREALSNSKDKPTISMKVLRNGASESITVRVPKVIKKADL